MTVRHCTLTGNRAGTSGGGIFRTTGAGTGSVTLLNSIVAGNTAPASENLGGPIVEQGVNFTSGDPLLAALGSYGGPTQTMPPLPGSPAIDAAGTVNPGGTDQRGFPRFADGDLNGTAALDIGAVELHAARVANTSDSGAGSLRQAVEDPYIGYIGFDPTLSGATLTLAGGQLLIGKSLTIDASALSGGFTINADEQSRVMDIQPGNTVALHRLTLTGGRATTGGFPAYAGGAILNHYSNLTLTACTLSGNLAVFGGAVFNQGRGRKGVAHDGPLRRDRQPCVLARGRHLQRWRELGRGDARNHG